MNGYVFGGVLLLIIALAFDSIVRVSTINYGVVTFFGKRTGRVLYEGWHLVWPLGINKVELVPFDLKTTNVEVVVVCKDLVTMTLKGSVQYRPTGMKSVRNSDKKPLLFNFLEADETTIRTGLTDAIKDSLGAITGSHEADEFVERREALAVIIDATLKLKTTPHINRTLVAGEKETKKYGNVVPPGGRIRFYEKNLAAIIDLIDNAHRDPTTISPIEERYGLDIETFALASVEFDPKTRAAFEEARQRRAEAEAIKRRTKAKTDTFADLQAAGLNKVQANDASNVLVGVANPLSVIDVRGGGSLPIINIANPNPKGGN